MNRQAIRCRDPKSKPMEGAILQVNVPTLVPGGCWAAAGAINTVASTTSPDAMRPLSIPSRFLRFIRWLPDYTIGNRGGYANSATSELIADASRNPSLEVHCAN
jgi:hypothetical protein